MPVFAVHYRYVDRPEVVTQHCPAHRDFLRDLLDRGIVLAAGAYTEGPAGALLVFNLMPTRSALVSGLKIATFEMARGMFFKTIPPSTPRIGFGFSCDVLQRFPGKCFWYSVSTFFLFLTERRQPFSECYKKWLESIFLFLCDA